MTFVLCGDEAEVVVHGGQEGLTNVVPVSGMSLPFSTSGPTKYSTLMPNASRSMRCPRHVQCSSSGWRPN